jgi:hypothetical protein
MSPAASTSNRAEALLAQVTALVKATATTVARGEVVDLTGLDRIIAGLCADIREMPTAHGSQLAPPLADLMTELDRLAEAMAAQRDQFFSLSGQAGGPSAAGAAAAYRKTSS